MVRRRAEPSPAFILRRCFVTQKQLNLAVAIATGETEAEVARRGFGIADDRHPEFDLEPRAPLVYDWDRRMPIRWPEQQSCEF